MKQILSLLLSSYTLLQQVNSEESVVDDIDSESIVEEIQPTPNSELASACNELEDGLQWIRPFDGLMDNGEEWPNIKVRCKDGWTILDYDIDSYISNYFSTFQSWTEYAASSKLDDRVTWREWFLPSTEDSNMKFRVSEDCHSCSDIEDYSDNSAYYMTGNYIGCLWVTKGYCDMDTDTLECYECSVHPNRPSYSGLCTHMETAADTAVYTEHDLCTTNSYNAIPSLGTNGEYCVCYQPESISTYDAASSFEREDSDESASITSEVETRSPDTEVKITNDDFKYGTYRITQPGTYILQEDIELNMNAPSDYLTPNGMDAWYPSEDVSDMYEGADGSFVGAYSMGFFAGFAIESSDVTVDLNGYEIKMSKEFHLQQRWFAHIEIGSKAFISGQGPGNFGAFLVESENIVIKNGVLGLSSHHGIHGNSANLITIQDLVIKDFEVAGIALNGFDGVTIENVEVGPVYTQVPVLGVYTQARVMLPRMRKVMEETDDSVHFDYRTKDKQAQTMEDLEGTLERQMDTIFHHVIEGAEYTDENPTWAKAKETFLNENGIPSASTVYGIFLNSLGASVFAIGGAPGNSYNAVVKNVKIHGLINDPWEVPRLMNTKGPFNDIVDVTRASDNGMIDVESAKYLGNAYTDAQYALNQLTDSWSILSHSAWTDPVVNWIDRGQAFNSAKVSMKCNNDIMLHVTKGVFGLRLDSVDNFVVDNVVIEELQNIGYYGSSVCGNYMSEDDGGHRNQRAPMQTGYTGTEMHGMTLINSKGSIDNLYVSKLVSARGDATGLQIFPGNEVELGKIEIKDIHAGAYSKSDDVMLYLEKPNKMPRGCAIDVWTFYDEDDDTLQENKVTYTDDSKLSASCVSGLTQCAWAYSEELTSDIGDCSIDDGNLIDSDQVVEGATYLAIESNNGGLFSGMCDKLNNQDDTRDNGNIAKLLSQMESDKEAVDTEEIVDDEETAETEQTVVAAVQRVFAHDADGGAVADSDQTADDTAGDEPEIIIPVSKGSKNNNLWIYILVIAIVLAVCLVLVFRKCLRVRPIQRNNVTIEGTMKANRTNKKVQTNYASTDSAEYTPLIHTGPAF